LAVQLLNTFEKNYVKGEDLYKTLVISEIEKNTGCMEINITRRKDGYDL